MDTKWSHYIQTTEELYWDRSMRFNDQNKELWLHSLGVKPKDKVLEIGCAGGAFCHRLAQYIPDIEITGLDFDIDHITYARAKTQELGLPCEFINGDAKKLPFAENTFDVCYSHTVAEHIPPDPFFGEQYRVLKKGGRIVVFSCRTNLGIKKPSDMTEEENTLLEKAWEKADGLDRIPGIGAYEMEPHEYPKELEKYGFKHVDVQVFTIMPYAPDNASVSDEMAVEQINNQRLSQLSGVWKALNMNPDALSEEEADRLINLIHQRFDERINKYQKGERLWDFSAKTVLAVSGIK